eukprot:TRINITY_DN69_c0_g1_i2.p2 TRINITY_DN69_c0_g1~~TRINITY_DN69_c0_g1_i2.p2  ORF type:complete len:262 (+),score=79.97 TRINITY_DN69_c0_g1_i2:46-831(+)
MALGKNKRRPKKGSKKRIVDPFTRKDWYEVKVPGIFKVTNIGKTFVNQTSGKILASDGLKGRVFRCSLGDLNKDEARAYRTINFIAEDVQGREVLTNFYGMNFTSDMLKSLVRKWQTTIEAFVDVKTTDGYSLRLFALGFTKKRSNQRKLTSYAQSSQVRQIRAKMVEIMTREATTTDLKNLFQKFVAESIGKSIESETEGIYPLQNVYVVKAKILKRPKFDPYKLADLHVESATNEDVGEEVGEVKGDADGYEPEHAPVQ